MKKVLATLLAATMAVSAVAGLAACGGDDKGQTLTVWAPEASHATYQAIAEQWKTETGHTNWTVNFEAKAEGEAETDFGADPAAGADVFFFESGQITTMKQKLYLQTLDAEMTAKIRARDGSNANGVIGPDGLAWAFPATADNGYFMWYDKAFFNGVDMSNASLDSILDKIDTYNTGKADAEKKTFIFKYDDGWYESSWFFGTGVEMDWIEGTNNYYTNIKGAKGQTAAKASMKYLARDAITTGDDGAVTTGFKNGTVVAAVRGTWIKSALLKDLGYDDDHPDSAASTTALSQFNTKYGAAKLPSFTVDGDDNTYHMGSFSGGKFCGVNRYKNNVESITASISLAEYLTREESQLKRFRATGAIPSNSNAAATQEVKEDMLNKAFSDQMETCSYVQLSQDGLWDAMSTFGTDCHDKKVNLTNLSSKLSDLATGMAKGGTLVENK